MTDSAFLHELNRLANITTVTTKWDRGEARAANEYAATSGLDVVGALNVKAGNAVGSYKDLEGVVNQLAGTTDLGVVEALSRIS